MWTMREQAAFPWNFPSVWRGLRLKKHAPLSCATACASIVLPPPTAPYSNTECAAATLRDHKFMTLGHPPSMHLLAASTNKGIKIASALSGKLL